jgi:hypothetical protein
MGTHTASRQTAGRQVLPVAFLVTATVAWVAKVAVDGARPFHNDEFWTWVAVLAALGVTGAALGVLHRGWGWRACVGTTLGVVVALGAVLVQTVMRSA